MCQCHFRVHIWVKPENRFQFWTAWRTGRPYSCLKIRHFLLKTFAEWHEVCHSRLSGTEVTDIFAFTSLNGSLCDSRGGGVSDTQVYSFLLLIMGSFKPIEKHLITMNLPLTCSKTSLFCLMCFRFLSRKKTHIVLFWCCALTSQPLTFGKPSLSLEWLVLRCSWQSLGSVWLWHPSRALCWFLPKLFPCWCLSSLPSARITGHLAQLCPLTILKKANRIKLQCQKAMCTNLYEGRSRITRHQ